jgi:hypothetical protein
VGCLASGLRPEDGEGGRRIKGDGFLFYKNNQPMNSNMNLNSNTPKTMQHHVYNSELLYFII